MELLAIEEGTKVIGVTRPLDEGGYTFAEGTILIRNARNSCGLDDADSVHFKIVKGEVSDELGVYSIGDGVFLGANDFVLAE